MQTPSSPARRPAQRRSRVDVRRRALAITAVTTVVLGALLASEPHTPSAPSQPDLRFADLLKLQPRPPASGRNDASEVSIRFQQGVMMLQMRQYEYALTAFHQVLALAPRMPEAHANMGFALLGLEQWQGARDFFESAIELRRDQMNAYYGLAIALEELGDVPGAMGAMQTYLHRASADDPFRARAESALWEWRTAKQNQTDASSQPTANTPR